MQIISFETKSRREIIDITDMIEAHLPKDTGLCHMFLMHTTGAITTGELDPGTDQDYLDAFEAMMPKLNYRHPHDPAHVVDHIWSSIIGTSITIPYADGKLMLGKWQRVIFIEFYGPKEREVVLSLIKPSN